MKRAKRKALLKLLRVRPINTDNFYSVAVTPELAAKLIGVQEWMNVWASHLPRQSGKSGMQRDFIKAELRKALKAIDKDAEFNFYWPPGVMQHDLNDLPPDLTITFAKSTDLSEAGRAIARKWLEDNFSAVHPRLRDNGRKNPLVLGSPDRLLGEYSHGVRVPAVRRSNSGGGAIKDSVLCWNHPLMDQALRLSDPKNMEEMISTAEYAARKAFLRRGGVPKPEVEPETMADFVARVKRTLKHINPSAHQPSDAVDSTVLSDFFDKEHMALVQEAVKEFGLAKSLEYRSMPTKPEDYASYNVLSAISELEKDDEA